MKYRNIKLLYYYTDRFSLYNSAEDDYMLGEKIKGLRKSRNLTQGEVANDLGVSKGCVSNWENDNTLPSIEQLKKIAIFYNVSADYLLDIEFNRGLNTKNLNNKQLTTVQTIIDMISTNNKSNKKEIK